ncbi:MAG TPA: hypothetical protein VGK65_20905, partial [Candidatus Binatia bacterium]
MMTGNIKKFGLPGQEESIDHSVFEKPLPYDYNQKRVTAIHAGRFTNMKILQIPLLRDNYGYLLVCEKSRQAAIVDPSEAEPV